SAALANERDHRTESALELRNAILEAAREVGVEIGTDCIGAFVRRVGGTQLEERNEILDRAREHTINSADGMRLTHVTSSLVSEGPPDGPTVADRPSVATLEKVRDLPSELLPTVFDEDNEQTGVSADLPVVVESDPGIETSD